MPIQVTGEWETLAAPIVSTPPVGAELEFSTPLVGVSTMVEEAEHQENLSAAGFSSGEWHALVHRAIPIDKARRIPKANAAIDKEFNKLDQEFEFVDWSSVREKTEVAEEARRNKVTVHFGSLMILCHEKDAQLLREEAHRIYKGRFVFRGDMVKRRIRLPRSFL